MKLVDHPLSSVGPPQLYLDSVQGTEVCTLTTWYNPADFRGIMRGII